MRDERFTSLPRCGLLAMWALGPALGCGAGAEQGAAATAAAPATTTYTCGLQVSKKSGGEYTGKASAGDAAAAEEAAWTDVCAKLPEPERPTCRDETKWQVTRSKLSTGGEGPTAHGTTIQLVAIAPSFAGEASSAASSVEACTAALADACAKAGAPGDCVAAGYEKQGETINKKTVMAKP